MVLLVFFWGGGGFVRKSCQNNVDVDIDTAPSEALVSPAYHCETHMNFISTM